MCRKVKLLALVYDILPPRRKCAGKSNTWHWFTTSFLQGGNEPESQTLGIGLLHPSSKEKVKLFALVYDILPRRRKWAGKSNSCRWFTTSFLQGENVSESQTPNIGLRHPSSKEEIGRKVKLLVLVYNILPPRRKCVGKLTPNIGLRHPSSKKKMCQKAELLTLKMCRKVKPHTLVYAILPPRRKCAGKSNSLRHPSSKGEKCRKARYGMWLGVFLPPFPPFSPSPASLPHRLPNPISHSHPHHHHHNLRPRPPRTREARRESSEGGCRSPSPRLKTRLPCSGQPLPRCSPTRRWPVRGTPSSARLGPRRRRQPRARWAPGWENDLDLLGSHRRRSAVLSCGPRSWWSALGWSPLRARVPGCHPPWWETTGSPGHCCRCYCCCRG